MGFLYIALKCIHVLAWPSFALGYPLYASIRAIENKSSHDMRKLITYWILFSMISLFELAFFSLLQWVTIWPYLKLVIISCLTLPHFEGAYHVYESFVQPCLHVDIEEIINRLSKKKEATVKPENFLALAERYVKENGTEALEKLIISKVPRAYFDVEEIKATADAEEIVLAPKVQSKVNLSQKDIKAAAANMVNFMDSNLVQTEKKTDTAEEEKEKTMLPEPGEKALPAEDPLDKVQKEWECAMCQVKTGSEVNLNDHLGGRKHKAKCEELKAQAKVEKLAPKNKASSSSCSSLTLEKLSQVNQTQEGEKRKKRKKKLSLNMVKGLDENLFQKDKKANAAVDDKEITMPLAAGEKALPAKVPFDEVQKEWACAMCQVKTYSAVVLNGHLQGRKHKAKCEELKAQAKLNKVTPQNKASSSSCSASTPDKSSPTKKKLKNLQLNVENEQFLKSADGVGVVDKNKTAMEEKAQDKQRGKANSEFAMHGYNCGLCDVLCTSEADLLSHLNGKKHLSRVQGEAPHPGFPQGWDYGVLPVFDSFVHGQQVWDYVNAGGMFQ